MSQQPLPAAVKLTVSLVVLEVLALLFFTVSGVMTANDLRGASVVGSFFLLIALSLVIGVVALWKHRPFSRALILVWQFFGVVIGVQTALSDAPLYGVPVVLLSGAIIILMFTQPLLRHTRQFS